MLMPNGVIAQDELISLDESKATEEEDEINIGSTHCSLRKDALKDLS